jgi:hypothetical protein
LWFLVNGGVGVIDPRHIPSNKFSPPVSIEQITDDRFPAHRQNAVRPLPNASSVMP